MYIPNEPVGISSLEDLRLWVRDELRAISQSLSETTTLELRPSFREPDRPREGMIVYADGTSWNPGGGEGPYVYRNGAWVLLA